MKRNKRKYLQLIWNNLIVNIPAIFSIVLWLVMIVKMADMLSILNNFDEPFKIIGIMVWAVVFLQIPSMSRIVFQSFKDIR